MKKDNINFIEINNGAFSTQEFLNKLCDINQRDILSSKMKGKEVSFSTTINFKSITGFNKVIKHEVFEFETIEDAQLFFYEINKSLY